jgi:hypothetical protein
MKKFIINAGILLAVIFVAADVYPAGSRKKYFTRPQVGAWYGPVTPIYDTGEHVNPDLGGGGFVRYNLPYEPLKLGFDASYQKYSSKAVDSLRLVPAYFNLLYLLPFDFPVRFQVKAGAGWCNVYMRPDEVKQWDPMFMAGLEVSFPAGQTANIALRIDYLCIYEEYLGGAKTNGYVINTGISLYLNLNL